MDLQTHVFEALDNAKANGYSFNGWTDDQIADDLLDKDADIEGSNKDEVIEAVSAYYAGLDQ